MNTLATQEKIMTQTDWSRRFMPESLTPLYHTPLYRQLSVPERLRYNQLHGLYFHEQIIFFEQQIIVPVLQSLRPLLKQTSLVKALTLFIEEENRHSRGFHALLRKARPVAYADQPWHFIDASDRSLFLLNNAVSQPRLFPLFLWLVQILEERAMHCSKVFLQEEPDLEPDFVSIQRNHLADEVDHVRWDEELIEVVWGRIPIMWRHINIRILSWMLWNYIVAPKRAALRVIDDLTADFGQLSVDSQVLKNALYNLGLDHHFCRSIFRQSIVPRTSRLIAKYPEWRNFAQYWFYA